MRLRCPAGDGNIGALDLGQFAQHRFDLAHLLAGIGVGLAFGAGVEQAITSNVSLRAEYQQTRFYDVESTVGGLGRTDDLTSHALKAGINFRF